MTDTRRTANPKREAIWMQMPRVMQDELAAAARHAGVPRTQFIREAAMMRARIEQPTSKKGVRP
jgi:hypothetical protein